MYTKCKENNLHVRKEDIRLILSLLDPSGVEHRKARCHYFSKGQNYIWHFDSYDKLKPYGICINGCIDGFSRKIIWLNAYKTSSDPKVIGGYYIETVDDLSGYSRIVRGDCGTENVHVRDFQRFLRRNNIQQDFNTDSYLEVASTANQRIESWWGFLRKECMEFFISLFVDVKDRGLFDGGFLDKNLIRFCFMGIIQDELDKTAHVWDAHVIRPSKIDRVPSGRPNIMYLFPELYRAENYLLLVESGDLQLCKTECTFQSSIPCDSDVYDICNTVMAETHFDLPNDSYQAIDLYLHLRNEILTSL
ncbi:uncharacterized protein LOC127427138 [Myxocyprinus asiaticus]|uniref:uncharacterized protein LOC127427138 n=1 Tax=Myxocyprinus asiaticus TaxID=70543 RepID=UPI002221A5BC|nr:uncharacterized protein LOC127427138 [Myxocyprinus asiaticus]